MAKEEYVRVDRGARSGGDRERMLCKERHSRMEKGCAVVKSVRELSKLGSGELLEEVQ